MIKKFLVHQDPKLVTKQVERRVRRACVLALIALGFIAWSLIDPGPLPLIGAMSIAQALGTLSLVLFLYAIFADVRQWLSDLRGSGATGKSKPPPSAETAESQKPAA